AGSIAKMDQAIEAEDLEAWAEADESFHQELVRLGGNKRVEAIVAMMSDQVRRARATTLFIRPLPVKSNEDHRVVFQAISEGRPDAARERHRTHRLQAQAMLCGILEKHRLNSL
ncbi:MULTISPECIES: FCD domain-containing protein, partial [unclassified Ruegeria]